MKHDCNRGLLCRSVYGTNCSLTGAEKKQSEKESESEGKRKRKSTSPYQ
jgi:hypothetical protein